MKPASVIGLTVLVVEDEPHTQDLVARRLRQSGYTVLTAVTRAEVLAQVDQGRCGAIVLDLGLPGDDGIAIARAVREISDVPILMLTGRAGLHSRLEGLDAGADDYLIKPFAPDELEARLRAILRRARGPASAAIDPQGPVQGLALGDAVLDCAGGQLTGPSGSAQLTAREVRLLMALARSAGPLSREAVSREIYQRTWDPMDRSLDVHMANLRRKFGAVLGERPVIGTVRGEGYELRVPARFMGES